MEKDIKITCRKQDLDATKKAAEQASSDFEEKSGFKATLEVVVGLSEEASVLCNVSREYHSDVMRSMTETAASDSLATTTASLSITHSRSA